MQELILGLHKIQENKSRYQFLFFEQKISLQGIIHLF